MSLDAHIVSHTHWDREWYHPVERFQQRLVALLDDLLDDPPRADENFLLDGQAIVLDDYLGVRPDRAPELSALLREGRLEAGPWYVLADELIPSGEAIVRNLFAGRRALARLGASSPNVLYCPDSFGHPAALPSIAAGFGLPLIVLWRGYGGPRRPGGDTVRWIAPGGDVALLFHLPRDGYEVGSHLPVDAAEASHRWHQLRAELAPRAVTGTTLLPNGADHHARQRHHREAIAAMRSAARLTEDDAHPSSLRSLATSLIAGAEHVALADVRGELRDSYGYTWTLQGTFGTRAHEKRLNAHAERLLLRHAEPWSALARFCAPPAVKATSRRHLVDLAWRTLLGAHPHDTLCGCSIDEVAQAMELRLRSAANQARGIRDDALADLIGHDAVSARDARDRWTPIVILRNPAARQRSGVAIIDLQEFVADVPVGPGSAARTEAPPAFPSAQRTPRVPALGTVQVLARRRENSLTESPQHYPDNDLVDTTRVAAWVSDIPGYGIVCHPLDGARRTARPAPDRVHVQRKSVRNGALAVTVDDSGVVSMEHVETARHIDSLFGLLDDSDVGDLYTPATRGRPFAVEFRGMRVVHRGPLRGELLLKYSVRASRASGASTRIADVDIGVVLDASAPFLRLNVTGRNLAEDHRLRLSVCTDVRDGEIWADAAFGPVRREPIVVTPADAVVEMPPPTAPMHRYVSRFGVAAGATIFSDGLAEYEARNDGSVILTLVRSVGELSRNDLPERPGHAGWPRRTPGAQCLGAFAGQFAVMLHGPRQPSTIDAIEQSCEDVLNPIRGVTLRSAIGTRESAGGVTLNGAGLAMSAIKESESREWLVLRCVNLTDVAVAGSWTLPFGVTDARRARLDETIMSEIAMPSGARTIVAIIAKPREIVTILVR